MADDFFFSEREYSQIRKQVEWFQGMNVIWYLSFQDKPKTDNGCIIIV